MGVLMCSTGKHISFISVSPMQAFDCDCPKQCGHYEEVRHVFTRCSLEEGHAAAHRCDGAIFGAAQLKAGEKPYVHDPNCPTPDPSYYGEEMDGYNMTPRDPDGKVETDI
jgi:hypothetical protein